MPTYRITDKQSGRTVTIRGNAPPSEADAEGIFAQAGLRGGATQGSQSQAQAGGAAASSGEQTPRRQTQDKLRFDFGDALARGLPGVGSYMDEIAGGALAAPEYIWNKANGKPLTSLITGEDTSWGGLYNKWRDRYLAGERDYQERHPIANTGGRALGTVAGIGPTTVATVGGGIRSAFSNPTWQKRALDLLKLSGKSAAIGGGVGAVQGFGEGETLGERTDSAVGGGLGGAGLGAVLPPALSGAVSLGRTGYRGIRNAVNAFRPQGQREIASKVLREAAGPRGAAFDTPALPGMRPTAGQATNNPGLLWLERSLEQGSPRGAVISREAREANNASVLDAINTLGDATTDSATAMATRIEAADEAGKQAYRAAWRRAGVDEDTTKVLVQPLRKDIAAFRNELPKAYKDIIPADVRNVLSAFKPRETLKEIQALRSIIGGHAAQMARSGNANGARVLGGLSDRISRYLDDSLNAMGGAPVDPTKMAAYDAARQATRTYKETFNQPKEIRNVLGLDRYGSDRIPVSATADQFIRSGKGAPEALESYLRAVGDDAPALQAGRDAFTQRFLRAVEGTEVDAAGRAFVKPASITKFIEDHRHVINSRLFTGQQRAVINRIQIATNMAQRTARAGAKGGSDTFAKLSGNRFLDYMIGPNASKILPAAASTIGYTTTGPLGGAVGLSLGLAGENTLAGLMSRAPREAVLNILNEAMADPRLAEALMQPATAGSAARIPASVQAKLYGLLSGTTAERARHQ